EFPFLQLDDGFLSAPTASCGRKHPDAALTGVHRYMGRGSFRTGVALTTRRTRARTWAIHRVSGLRCNARGIPPRHSDQAREPTRRIHRHDLWLGPESFSVARA